MEVQVWVAGRYNNYVQAPLPIFQIVITIIAAKAQRLRAGYQHRKWFKRKVTFIVTKPIINGINITSQSLVEVAGRLGMLVLRRQRQFPAW